MATCLLLSLPPTLFKLDVICFGFTESAFGDNGLAPTVDTADDDGDATTTAADDEKLTFSTRVFPARVKLLIWFFPKTMALGATTFSGLSSMVPKGCPLTE